MENFEKLKIKKLNKESVIPKKCSQYAAGYDLYASENCIVKAQDKAIINTGISISVPKNSYGRIAPRSGLAAKNFIDVGAGVIDEDYRGEVRVILFNHSKQDFEVWQGDRIAQLIIERITPTIIEEVDDLDSTERGNNGFGSTGVQQ